MIYAIDDEIIEFVLKAPPPFLSPVEWSRRNKPLPGKPGVMRITPKVGRNDLCQCGSGKKTQKMLPAYTRTAKIVSTYYGTNRLAGIAARGNRYQRI